MKRILSLLAISVAALSLNPAFAHGGGKPKYGGIVAVASDLSFELVAAGDGAAIYIEDHGKPMAPTGMSGKLTVLADGKSSEAALSAGADKLEAKGLQLPKGAKVVAVLSSADKKPITVRFTVK
jgi:hypothetical protein